MNFRQNIAYFIRHLREKHRLSVRNQHTDREIWYMHISPLNLLAGLLARAVVVIGEDGKIIYEELVPEITHEPDYDAVMKALK